QPPSQKQPNIGKNRFQNQGQNSISSIVGSYKSVVTQNARKIESDFGWQSRFYDHLVKNDRSLKRIKKYIVNNPRKWEKDRFKRY
ncbi:MAG: transposase, partial [Candidatus Marinimicrobia bacterium]|nr:transposase [Candidatus Neomarinimicrobiota bacterium]